MSNQTRYISELKPIKTHIELCYKCKCGCIHWVESRLLKHSKYQLECWCGKVLIIPQTKAKVIYHENTIINSNTNNNFNSNSVKQAFRILRNQGFTLNETNEMMKNIEKDVDITKESVETIIRKALQTIEV